MKPILFNTQMVKAILDGQKTQTRRIMTPQPSAICKGMYCDMYNKNPNKWTFWTTDGRMCLFDGNVKNTAHWKPQYQIEDILYVRETFHHFDYETPLYKADYPIHWSATDAVYGDEETDEKERWKPSIHMPKKYARIFLKVTNVRVERLQDISDNDIKKEGLDDDPRIVNYEIEGSTTAPYVKKEEFIIFWNSTAKDRYKWEDNPYVFIYEFKRV